MLTSVIIPNYNYGRYLRDAIDSALAQRGHPVEVIVVDDGSTDESREIIAGYSDRVQAIFQANGGQTAACNAGFERARGELVVFLDSDDLLHPELLNEVMKVWRPGVSKVQVQMQVVDSLGRPTGGLLPNFRSLPSALDVRRWVARSGCYVTPPGSGNVYSREFLSKVHPLCGSERTSDSYYLEAAPHFGDVLTIAKPLASYRVHSSNTAAMDRLDPKRLSVDLKRAYWRTAYGDSLLQSAGRRRATDVRHRSLTTLALRLSSLKVRPDLHPVAGDSVLRALLDFAPAAVAPQGISARSVCSLLLWALCTAAAPAPVAEKLVSYRYVPSTRPRALTKWMARLGIVARANSATA